MSQDDYPPGVAPPARTYPAPRVKRINQPDGSDLVQPDPDKAPRWVGKVPENVELHVEGPTGCPELRRLSGECQLRGRERNEARAELGHAVQKKDAASHALTVAVAQTEKAETEAERVQLLNIKMGHERDEAREELKRRHMELAEATGVVYEADGCNSAPGPWDAILEKAQEGRKAISQLHEPKCLECNGREPNADHRWAWIAAAEEVWKGGRTIDPDTWLRFCDARAVFRGIKAEAEPERTGQWRVTLEPEPPVASPPDATDPKPDAGSLPGLRSYVRDVLASAMNDADKAQNIAEQAETVVQLLVQRAAPEAEPEPATGTSTRTLVGAALFRLESTGGPAEQTLGRKLRAALVAAGWVVGTEPESTPTPTGDGLRTAAQAVAAWDRNGATKPIYTEVVGHEELCRLRAVLAPETEPSE